VELFFPLAAPASDAKSLARRSAMTDATERNHHPEHRLEVLYNIAKDLGARSSCQAMLDTVLGVLGDQLGLHNGTIMLVSPDGSELSVEAVQTPRAGANLGARYQRGEGVLGEVLKTGSSVVIPRMSDEPRFQGRVRPRKRHQTRELSFICVPIPYREQVLGTLSVELRCRDEERLVEVERLLGIVACMIATNVRARHIAQTERHALEEENRRLRKALGRRFRPDNMIGNTREMGEVFQRIQQVAPSNSTVLVRGESGTGKELVSAAIHFRSPRAERPFVKVNCTQLNENLLESELFGHERGAFTGASQLRIGRFEEASGGTLFLDEIGDFSPAIQVKLLRVLQERTIQRVGSSEDIPVDVRIITATHRPLEELVEAGKFRRDFYYRVNVFSVCLPPLRQRRSDIPDLANHFVGLFAQRMNKTIHRISTTAINMMLAYHWPGNVRELENCIEHAVLLSQDGVVHGRNLPPTLQMPETLTEATGTLKWHTQLLEKDLITDALKRHDGSVRDAARELGLTPRMVRYKIANLGIARPTRRAS
jgi:Nif-specific regulatory protein